MPPSARSPRRARLAVLLFPLVGLLVAACATTAGSTVPGTSGSTGPGGSGTAAVPGTTPGSTRTSTLPGGPSSSVDPTAVTVSPRTKPGGDDFPHGPSVVPTGESGTSDLPTGTPPPTGAELPSITCPPSTADELPARTPTGAPVITATAGANAWVVHPATEPLALAVYPDGTVITSTGSGGIAEPLPALTIGRIPVCEVDWAVGVLRGLDGADMGQATVTDQGTTVVTVRHGGSTTRLSVYALDFENQSMLTATQQQHRAQLRALLDTVATRPVHPVAWTPDRLRVTTTTRGIHLPTHVWPGPQSLVSVAGAAASHGCAVITGATAAGVLAELGSGVVLAEWTQAGKLPAPVALVIGVLVPGQPDCA